MVHVRSIMLILLAFQLLNIPVESLRTVQQMSLLVHYFKSNSIGSLVAYVCNSKDAVTMANLLISESNMLTKLHTPNSKENFIVQSTHHPHGIILDYRCYDEDNQWINSMLNTSYAWLVYVDQLEDLTGVENLKINLLSNVVVVSNCSAEECWLFDAYRTRESDPLNLEEFGRISSESKQLRERKRRNDFGGTTLIGGLVLKQFTETFPASGDLENKSYHLGKDSFSRYHLVLFRHLERFYNFKLDVVRSDNYGFILPNGSIGGIMGDVSSGRIDIGVTSVQQLLYRVQVVNFLPQLWEHRLIFVFRQPRALGSFSALAVPLSYNVWACVVGFALLFSGAYELIQHSSGNKKNGHAPLEGFTVVVGVLAQQGLIVDEKRTSNRILSFFLLFLALMVLIYYNAAVMNGLLQPAPVSIRSLDQLISPISPIKVGVLNVSYLVDKRSSRYVRPKVAEAIRRTPNSVMGIKSGIERVRNTNFALAGDEVSIYEGIESTFSDGEKCDLTYISLIKPFGLSCSVAKNSPFKEMFTRGFIYMQENGIAHRERSNWQTRRPDCSGSISFYYVSLTAVGISFSIYLIGVFLSIVIFVSEYYLDRLHKPSQLFLIK